MPEPKPLLQLKEIEKQIGPRILFHKADLLVNEQEHIALIGQNGTGKTTLFKLLAEELPLESGSIERSRNTQIGYLHQETPWNIEDTAEDYLSENCSLPIWELKSLGRGLGLAESHFSSPLKSLSGGYRMRMKLLYLIGQSPNLMLLDEPTNFLDLETLLVLENFLKSFKGAFILISHDREFLRRTTNVTIEIEHQKITRFNGNIDTYFEQKAQWEANHSKALEKQAEKREQVMAFAARFGAKATKAKQVQSRLRQLEKTEQIEQKAVSRAARIQIPPPVSTGKQTLSIEHANVGYADKVVLKDVDFQLQRQDHLAVVGFNGAGKSTLLKSLAQQLPLLSGNLQYGHQVTCGYYAQHVPESLLPEETVLEALTRLAHPEVDSQSILDLAGSLLFVDNDVHKKVKVLSGGEKARVAIGQILLQKAPCLLLDEPTNHLDFMTVEALTTALSNYTGSLIVVSHDRQFIRNIATKILEIKDGKALFYPGTYDEYLWSLEKGILSDRQNDSNSMPTKKALKNASTDKKTKHPQKNLSKQLRQTEQKVEKLEQKLAELEKQFETISEDALQALSEKYSVTKSELELAEKEWLTFLERMEASKN